MYHVHHRHRQSILICIFMVMLPLSIFVQAATITPGQPLPDIKLAKKQFDLVYPRPESEMDIRNQFPLALLKLAARKMNISLRLHASRVTMQQQRALLLINRGEIDVFWTVVDELRKDSILSIPFSVYKDLYNWRLILAHGSKADSIEAISSPCELAEKVAILGHDWPDVVHFGNAEINIVTSSSYEALFHMLQKKRGDYFPRAIFEVFQELDNHPTIDMQVIKKWKLYYPAEVRFILNPQRKDLARILQRGLEQSLEDGSYETLFQQYQAETIQRADLESKQVLDLTRLKVSECQRDP